MGAEKKARDLYGLEHIAFIMDGNGRWAKQHGMPREQGHNKGAKTFRNVVKYCREIGIKYVTVYAFSTENLLRRPPREVKSIMRLLDNYLTECEREMSKYNICINFIGNIEALEYKLREKIQTIQNKSTTCDHVLNIALNYGGRAELVRAYNILAASGKTNISEDDIQSALYTVGIPDPDLIVRTAGEYRLSNFLLWQASYAELYFTDVLWPDFDIREVNAAIDEYGKRRRRYGGV